MGDGASRNPEDRDEAQARLLAVKTDPKSVLSLFNLHEYHDEAEAVEDFLVHEGSGATRTRVRILFVPDFETTEPSQRLEALRVALCAEDARSELTFYVAPRVLAPHQSPDGDCQAAPAQTASLGSCRLPVAKSGGNQASCGGLRGPRLCAGARGRRA